MSCDFIGFERFSLLVLPTEGSTFFVQLYYLSTWKVLQFVLASSKTQGLDSRVYH